MPDGYSEGELMDRRPHKPFHALAMTDFAKQGKTNRRRGATGERELCKLIEDAFGVSCKRLLGQERDGGHDISLPPFVIEVKRRKAVANLYQWLDNVDRGLTVPAVALRADGKGWLVVMHFDDFAMIAREEVAINARAVK